MGHGCKGEDVACNQENVYMSLLKVQRERNQIRLQLSKAWPRVVVYPLYYFQYSLMIC